MRILTTGLLYNRLSGQDTFLFNMNKNMPNCDFDYFVLGDYCIHEERIKADGGKLQLVRIYWKSPFGYLLDNYKILKENRKDHEICYFNMFSMVHITPILLAILFKYRIVFHSHNSDLNKYWLIHRINRFFLGKLKNCTRLACSQKAAEFMFGKGNGREATIINNAIEVSRFRFSEENRRNIRNELGIGDNVVFGFVGRLDYQKNPLFLMEIIFEIAKKDDDARFIIVGDGSLREQVVDKVKQYNLEERVFLLGIRDDVEKIYSAMDVFLLPSIYEGLPIVLVETQAAGLVSIVSKEAVPYETCIDEQFVIYKSISEDACEWATKALEICRCKTDRYEWNDRVKDSKFNIELEAKRLEEIFMKTINE